MKKDLEMIINKKELKSKTALLKRSSYFKE